MTFFLEIGNHYRHKNKASDYPVSIFGLKKVLQYSGHPNNQRLTVLFLES